MSVLMTPIAPVGVVKKSLPLAISVAVLSLGAGCGTTPYQDNPDGGCRVVHLPMLMS